MKLIRRKPVHAAETFLVAVRKVEQGCVSENGRAPIAEPIMIATSTPRSTFSRLFAARRPCHNVAYGPRAIVFMPGMNTSPSSRNPHLIMGLWPMVSRVAREGRGRMSRRSNKSGMKRKIPTSWEFRWASGTKLQFGLQQRLDVRLVALSALQHLVRISVVFA